MTLVERPFRLERADGTVIRGEVRHRNGSAAPETAVVILHGFKGFRKWGFFPHLARHLSRAGHAAVTFDFSLNGVGPGGEEFDELEAFARNTFTREVQETGRVLQALAGGELPVDPPARVGLLGHSRGGGIAVLAADRFPVDALVTWAAVATFDRWDGNVKDEWRQKGRIHVRNARTGQDMPLGLTLLDDLEKNRSLLDIEAAAARIGIPWLIVHGQADASVSVEDARRLHGANPNAELVLIPDAGHTFGATHPFEGVGPHLKEALRVTREHLDRALGGG